MSEYIKQKIQNIINKTYLKDDEDKCAVVCYQKWKKNKEEYDWHKCMFECIKLKKISNDDSGNNDF